MKKTLITPAATLIFTLMASAAMAAPTQERVLFSAGSYDVDTENTPMYGIEYRTDPVWYDLQPMIGIQGDTNGSLYTYAGLTYDWEFFNNWHIAPNVAAGMYRQHSSKDLGGKFQFRSGIELGYDLPNEHRLGIAFHHLSNAGMYGKNPGVEQFMVTYSVPVNVIP
ncbi:MAG: acyloxyacyl hydrolase [Alphaproteobacteria bacterium]|nr:acyloxyacyl hydrolase [Alphaproteobacteria bacterium]